MMATSFPAQSRHDRCQGEYAERGERHCLLLCRPLSWHQFADVFPKTTIPDTTVLTWFDVVPRAGAAWDIKGNGKTVVKGSFGMFGDTMGFLYANLYNPESVQSRTYDWNGLCQATAPLAPVEWQCNVTPATLASLPSLPLVTQSGGISQVLNRNLKQDRTYEYVAKVERQLIPNLAFTAGYIRHSIYNNYNSTTNEGPIAPTETYTAVGVNTGIAVGHRSMEREGSQNLYLPRPLQHRGPYRVLQYAE
jgi:hypothetical protein